MTLNELRKKIRTSIKEAWAHVRSIEKEIKYERKINHAGFYLESTADKSIENFKTRIDYLEDFYVLLMEIKDEKIQPKSTKKTKARVKDI